MNKSFVFIAVLTISVIVISGCTQKTEIKFTTLKGVSLSPSAFTQDGMTDFFSKAGSIITWAGSWDQLIDNRSAPYVVQQLSSQYNYVPIIITEIKDDEVNSGLLRSRFRDTVAGFAGKYKPEYIGLGNEVNIGYKKSPQTFGQKMEFYSSVYDAIKAASPGTQVFTTFQLENMKGYLFNGSTAEPQWFLLDNASKFDIMAFTTYPSLIYEDPADMQNNYYSEIRMHTPKPIAFSEAAWGGDDYMKARFIRIFFLFNQDNHPEFAVWPFLYSQPVPKPFDDMGMITNTTVAFDAWKAA